MAGQRDDANLVLQRKITRIILSNGCCWIPICIMSFINAAGRVMPYLKFKNIS